jgi:hypothetical protein
MTVPVTAGIVSADGKPEPAVTATPTTICCITDVAADVTGLGPVAAEPAAGTGDTATPARY